MDRNKIGFALPLVTLGCLASSASAAVVFDASFVIGNLSKTGESVALSPRMISNVHLATTDAKVALNSITTEQGYTNSGTGAITVSPTLVLKFYTPAPAHGNKAADITTTMTLLGTITYALPTINLGVGEGQVIQTTIPGGGLVVPKDVAISTYYYETSDTSVITPLSSMHVNSYGWGYSTTSGGPLTGTATESYWDLNNNGVLAGGEEETIPGFFRWVPTFVIDASPAPVPEPTSVAVAGLAAPALLARRRSRRA